eukprot:TRINITY_DN2537_c0_g1_i1.p1 TRINITY_DN2537_c0_g1~~TRINITY_DN2537_c0_g1_i1.p1  ORF type:complete len:782 (-),score=111.65 TRINITY_DN2537_c0_g1_i1:391-2736(-)
MDKINTKDGCYASGCIPDLISGVPCASYCFVDTDHAGCTSLGTDYTWYDHDNGVCVFSGDYATCQRKGLQYFLGKDFVPSLLAPGQCESGFCSFIRTSTNWRQNPVDISESECNAYACSSCTMDSTDPECYAFSHTSPELTDEEYKDICRRKNTCITSGSCLVTDDVFIDQVKRCPWTPEGCLFGSGVACEQGGEFLSFSTQDACEEWSHICRETSILPTGSLLTKSQHAVPEGFSRKNEEECTKCNYQYENFFKWEQSEWVASRAWIEGVFGKPALIRPIWEPFVSQGRWNLILEEARAIRFGGISTTQLYCQFTIERKFIGMFTCNCRGTYEEEYALCAESLNSIYGTLVASTNVCSGGNAYNITGPRATLVVDEDFDAGNQQCSTVVLTSTDFVILKSPPAPISSLAIVSHTRRTVNNKRKYVYNDADKLVVVGTVVGDGFGLIVGEKNASGLTFCLLMPSREQILERWDIPNSDPYYVALAIYDEEKHSCVPTHVVEMIREEAFQACIAFSGSPLFFPVALLEDYQNKKMSTTWSHDELGLFIFCIIMYFFLFVFACLSLLSRYFVWRKDKHSILWNTAAIGLAILAFLALLRFVYFITAPFGYYDYIFGLVSVFSDLPTLLYYFILVYLSFTWLDIYRQSKTLNPSPRYKTLLYTSLIIGSLTIFWIAFYITFGVLAEEDRREGVQQVTCAFPETGDLTLTEKVSLTYKVIFSFYSVCLAIMFFVNSLLFVSLGLSKKKNTAVILEIISIITTLALLAQAVIAIVSIFVDMSSMIY